MCACSLFICIRIISPNWLLKKTAQRRERWTEENEQRCVENECGWGECGGRRHRRTVSVPAVRSVHVRDVIELSLYRRADGTDGLISRRSGAWSTRGENCLREPPRRLLMNADRSMCIPLDRPTTVTLRRWLNRHSFSSRQRPPYFLNFSVLIVIESKWYTENTEGHAWQDRKMLERSLGKEIDKNLSQMTENLYRS